jgi:hypothetical protein
VVSASRRVPKDPSDGGTARTAPRTGDGKTSAAPSLRLAAWRFSTGPICVRTCG